MSTTSDVDSLAKQARRFFQRGDLQQAISHFNQALEIDEGRADLHLGLGTVNFLAKDYEGAIAHFTRVTQLNPSDGRCLINMGAVYNRKGEYKKAVDFLRRGMQKEKNSVEGFYNLGYAHRKLNQFSMAVQAYREAIRIDSNMVEAHYNLANVYLEMKNNQQAILHYKKALEINPKFQRAIAGVEKTEKAIADAKQAISPFGRLVDSGSIRVKTAPTVERELTELERVQDRQEVYDLAADIDTISKQFLAHLRDHLDPSLMALNRAVAQGTDAPSVLTKAYSDFQSALSRFTKLRKEYKQKINELRAHEELINSPDLEESSD